MFHTPVLLQEVIQYLNLSPGKHVCDCNLGGGGHSFEILKKTGPDGHLFGFELDADARAVAEKHLELFGDRVTIFDENFRNLLISVSKYQLPISGVLFDLGISSYQLDGSERGFSFKTSSPLDMRFSELQETKASDVLNGYSRDELVRVFRDFGELTCARRLADEIVLKRKDTAFETTNQLCDVVDSACGAREDRKKSLWARAFQALRMEVNDEIGALQEALEGALDLLEDGGRLVVLSYHSLEDRVVKQFFKRESTECLCPPEFPQCICGHRPRVRLVLRKPIMISEDEKQKNPRARSVRMRVVEKISWDAT